MLVHLRISNSAASILKEKYSNYKKIRDWNSLPFNWLEFRYQEIFFAESWEYRYHRISTILRSFHINIYKITSIYQHAPWHKFLCKNGHLWVLHFHEYASDSYETSHIFEVRQDKSTRSTSKSVEYWLN